MREGDWGQALPIFEELHQVSRLRREAARPLRAAALFLVGYLRMYGPRDRRLSRRLEQDAIERFEALINVYADTAYAKIANGYLEHLPENEGGRRKAEGGIGELARHCWLQPARPLRCRTSLRQLGSR